MNTRFDHGSPAMREVIIAESPTTKTAKVYIFPSTFPIGVLQNMKYTLESNRVWLYFAIRPISDFPFLCVSDVKF